MFHEVDQRFDGSDILVMSAAVADAKPLHQSDEKIKKGSLTSVELISNPDIVATVAARKRNQIVIAFAAETSLNIEEGKRKLIAKSADILFLNDVAHNEIFGSAQTQGVILLTTGSGQVAEKAIDRVDKDTLADLLLDHALDKLG